MPRTIPFTAASLARAIGDAESLGERVIGVRADGKLLLESGSNGVSAPATIEEFIYFFSDGDFVKIGYSIDWRSRLKQLQAANPRELVVTAVILGTQADERTLHQRFAAHRVRFNNEWFRGCEEIADYIASVERVDI